MKSICTFLIILLSNIYNLSIAQNNIKGTVNSINGGVVEYAVLQLKNSDKSAYTNEMGQFYIKEINRTDTLTVSCFGFESSEIAMSDISNFENLIIELNPKDNKLEELIIQTHNNEKSSWKKWNKKPKKAESTYQALAEGMAIISSYTIDETVKFNGIQFKIMPNILDDDYSINRDYNKKIRVILLINSKKLDDNLLHNKIYDISKNERKEFINLDVEFSNTIEVTKGDILSVGLELLPDDENGFVDYKIMIGVLTTKHPYKNSKTMITNILKNNQSSNYQHNSNSSFSLNEDLLIEFKKVKNR